jgi:hypothetical protein
METKMHRVMLMNWRNGIIPGCFKHWGCLREYTVETWLVQSTELTANFILLMTLTAIWKNAHCWITSSVPFLCVSLHTSMLRKWTHWRPYAWLFMDLSLCDIPLSWFDGESVFARVWIRWLMLAILFGDSEKLPSFSLWTTWEQGCIFFKANCGHRYDWCSSQWVWSSSLKLFVLHPPAGWPALLWLAALCSESVVDRFTG